MILYASKPVTVSALERGLITLDVEGRNALLATVFRDDPENRDATLLIGGQPYPARLMNNAHQGVSPSVQLLCRTSGIEALRRLFSRAWDSLQRGEPIAEELMSIHETDEELVYEVRCGDGGAQPSEAAPVEPESRAFPEGRLSYARHARRERSPVLTRLAKERFKALHGSLYCEVCGFSFAARYGDIGEDFIEAHHVVPVSELRDEGQTRVEDLSMVCSNCHRMLHRRRPWLSANQLKELLWAATPAER